MKKIMIILVVCFYGIAQAQYKYGLKPVTLAEYKKQVQMNPTKELVDLEKFIPGIALDIRYATKNNFTKQVIYKSAKAYSRKVVAQSLKEAQMEFKTRGLGIKIYDAYRPYKATVKFYEVYHDTTYVASPFVGSRHNRGCALDMTLIDLKTGKEIEMPTEFDSFKREAWSRSPVRDPRIKRNRDQLIRVMEHHGFKVNRSEWWHFDFVGWQQFEVLDIDFEELKK